MTELTTQTDGALALADDERSELQRCEKIIERGAATFVTVGNALAMIREGRLYREAHRTFDEYIRERWDMTRPRAYQLMSAAGAVASLSTIVDTAPANEAQARPLTKLPESERAEAWGEAVRRSDGGQPTAATVAEVVSERRAKSPANSDTEQRPESAQSNALKALTSSASNEWYTPAEFIEAARTVMGGIDLDPASCAEANEVVGATMYYDSQLNGLTHEWGGRVWCNPPYSKTEDGESSQGVWLRHLVAEVGAGRTTQACMLCNAATGNAWWQPIWDASAICFPRRRIRFRAPGGAESKQPTQSNVIVYWGPNVSAFHATLRQFGPVVVPADMESLLYAGR